MTLERVCIWEGWEERGRVGGGERGTDVQLSIEEYCPE